LQTSLVTAGAQLKMTIVTDPDDDVVRIGFGDPDGLSIIAKIADGEQVELRSHPGLRLGVLMCDDRVMIWSPTPRAVEAAPGSEERPNGLIIGSALPQELLRAVAPGWSDNSRFEATIGRSDMHEVEIEAQQENLRKIPPVDVQLQRLTRMFSNKLQFVEFKVKGAKLSQSQMKVDEELFNADVQEELRHALRLSIKPFDELRDEPIDVPDFDSDGMALMEEGTQRLRPLSERELERRRNALTGDYFYEIPGYGALIEKERAAAFERRVKALEVQLSAHAAGLRELISKQSAAFATSAADLVLRRLKSAGASIPDVESLINHLEEACKVREYTGAKVSVVFKDVTYQQTKDEKFRKLVDRALPPGVKKRLGPWTEEQDVAPVSTRQETSSLPGE